MIAKAMRAILLASAACDLRGPMSLCNGLCLAAGPRRSRAIFIFRL